MNRHPRCILLAISLCLSMTGWAQQALIDQYLQTAADNAVIYNGEVEETYASTKYLNRPYLEGEAYLPGTMVYNGNRYDKLQLRFNLFKEQLVALSPKGKIGISLTMRRISEFTIGGRAFVHETVLPKGLPEEGYCEILFDGAQIKLVKKRKCMFNASEVYNNVSYFSFRFKDKYYFFSEGQYYPIGRRSLLYKLYPHHKKQLKKYSNEQKLDFRTNYEYALCELTTYLQSLLTQSTKE